MTRPGDNVRLLTPDGPITAVRSAFVNGANRERAVSPRRACDVVWQLARDAVAGDDRHVLCDLHQLVTTDRYIAYWRAETATLVRDVLDAVMRGELLILDGWWMGDSWTPAHFPTRSSA